MTEQLPQDVIARLRALDPAITPELAQASWALLAPFHEKLGYTAPRIGRARCAAPPVLRRDAGPGDRFPALPGRVAGADPIAPGDR
jgi:hypothetical protein